MELEYYVEVMDARNQLSIGKLAKSYDHAREMARAIVKKIIDNNQTGYIVMIKNNLEHILSFKVFR